ncbi:hypothetical protein TNCV_2950651 [Trichonephila clavipes]|nr:hypothetical protein TNCV_2950651 [Trichonephila clavipes]
MDAMLRRLEEEGAAATARPALRVHRATSQAEGGIRSTAASPNSPASARTSEAGKTGFRFLCSLSCPLPMRRGSMFPCGRIYAAVEEQRGHGPELVIEESCIPLLVPLKIRRLEGADAR